MPHLISLQKQEKSREDERGEKGEVREKSLYLLQDNRIEINFEFNRALAPQGNLAKMTCKFHRDNCLACVVNVLQTDQH